VLATAHADTGLARVVNECGVVTPPGDAGALAGAIRELQRHGIARRALGGAARRYAEQHLHKDAVLARFERELLRSVMKKGDTKR